MKNKHLDIDVDPGIFTVADYSRKDEESTPGEGHPEDETTGGAGALATIVRPNPKCNSCLHYYANRTACQVALYPTSCGDGSKPETGYAPSIADPAIDAAKRVKDGLKVSAPVARVVAGSSNGNDDPSAPGTLQLLGDELFSEGAHRNTRNGKELLQKAVKALNNVWRALPEEKREPYASPADFVDRLQKGKLQEEFGNEAAGAMYRARRLLEKAIPGMAYARARREVYHANASKTGLPTNAGISHQHMAAAAQGDRSHADAHVKKWKAAGSPNVRAKHGAAVPKASNLQLVHGPDAGGDKTKTSVRPASLKEGTVASKPSKMPTKEKTGMFSTAKKKIGGLLTRVGTKLAASMSAREAADAVTKSAAQAWQAVSPEHQRVYVKQAMARHQKAGERVKASKYEEVAPREFVNRLLGKSATFSREFGVSTAGELLKARREVSALLKCGPRRASKKVRTKETTQKSLDSSGREDIALVKGFITGKSCVLGMTASGKKITDAESGFSGWTAEDHRDAYDVISFAASRLEQPSWSMELRANPALRKCFNEASAKYRKLAGRHDMTARSKGGDALQAPPQPVPFEKSLNTDAGLAKALAENGLISERNLRGDGSVVSSLPSEGGIVREVEEVAEPERGPYALTIGGNVSAVHDTASPFLLGTK